MPTYNTSVGSTEAGVLIPREDSEAIFESTVKNSAALSLLTRVPISTNQNRFAVMDSLPQAYFVSPAATGRAQTSTMQWSAKYMDVEKIAVVIPMPRDVVEDVRAGKFNLTERIKPRMAEAIGRVLDAAIFFGTNMPTTWSSSHGCIVDGATTKGATYVRGTNPSQKGGVCEDLNQLCGKLELNGYAPRALVTKIGMRPIFRGARNAYGNKFGEISTDAYEGIGFQYAMDGQWPTDVGSAEVIAIDPAYFMVGVREEIRITVHEEGVINDAAGAVVLNLMQQDQAAIRAILRVGYAAANPINYQNSDADTRWPAAVLLSPGADSQAT